MSKYFLDEMIDALNELRLSEAQRVYDAVKNREVPPMTMKPSTVMKAVYQVAAKHHITKDELALCLGVTDLTGTQMLEMQQTADMLDTNQIK